MNKKEEMQINNQIRKTLESTRISGMRAGAFGILGAVLQMCNEGKTVDEIRNFCKKSLALDGIK